jgi:hypothetical protein
MHDLIDVYALCSSAANVVSQSVNTYKPLHCCFANARSLTSQALSACPPAQVMGVVSSLKLGWSANFVGSRLHNAPSNSAAVILMPNRFEHTAIDRKKRATPKAEESSDAEEEEEQECSKGNSALMAMNFKTQVISTFVTDERQRI